MYYMTHQTSFYHYDEYGCKDIVRKPHHCETDHRDDLIFTFGLPVAAKLKKDVKCTPDEKALTMCWMTYLANFAKHG